MKMVYKKTKDKKRMFHLSVDLSQVEQIKRLKQEKKIKTQNQFIKDAINEKLNPAEQNNSRELREQNERLNREIVNLRDESKCYYKQKIISKYNDYGDFLRQKQGSMMEIDGTWMVFAIPVLGWLILFWIFSIYLPLKYWVTNGESFYIKTEREIN